jgi:hypothetical protein
MTSSHYHQLPDFFFQTFQNHLVGTYYININQTRFCKKNVVTQSKTGLQIYEGRDDQLNRPGPMA